MATGMKKNNNKFLKLSTLFFFIINNLTVGQILINIKLRMKLNEQHV